jgi:hypothetical protein
MVLLGIKFDDNPLIMQSVADMIKENSEKDVAKMLFNVNVHCIGSDTLIIIKDFVAEKTINVLFSIMLIGACLPWLIWNVSLPLFVVAGLISFWAFISSKIFNFLMFKLMIRKRFDYKPKMVML